MVLALQPGGRGLRHAQDIKDRFLHGGRFGEACERFFCQAYPVKLDLPEVW